MSIFDSFKPADYFNQAAGIAGQGVGAMLQRQDAERKANEPMAAPLQDALNSVYSEYGDITPFIERLKAGEDPAALAAELKAARAGGGGVRGAPYQWKQKDLAGANVVGQVVNRPAVVQQRATAAQASTEQKANAAAALDARKQAEREQKAMQFAERMKVKREQIDAGVKTARERVAVLAAGVKQRDVASQRSYDAKMAATGVAAKRAESLEDVNALLATQREIDVADKEYKEAVRQWQAAISARDYSISEQLQAIAEQKEKEVDAALTKFNAVSAKASQQGKVYDTVKNKAVTKPAPQAQSATVKVRFPNGKVVDVPRADLKKAIEQYKGVEVK